MSSRRRRHQKKQTFSHALTPLPFVSHYLFPRSWRNYNPQYVHSSSPPTSVFSVLPLSPWSPSRAVLSRGHDSPSAPLAQVSWPSLICSKSRAVGSYREGAACLTTFHAHQRKHQGTKHTCVTKPDAAGTAAAWTRHDRWSKGLAADVDRGAAGLPVQLWAWDAWGPNSETQCLAQAQEHSQVYLGSQGWGDVRIALPCWGRPLETPPGLFPRRASVPRGHCPPSSGDTSTGRHKPCQHSCWDRRALGTGGSDQHANHQQSHLKWQPHGGSSCLINKHHSPTGKTWAESMET